MKNIFYWTIFLFFFVCTNSCVAQTETPTNTDTPITTFTPTPTWTPTITDTPTNTDTPTPYLTYTRTNTNTPAGSPLATSTPTTTKTNTTVPTITDTPTITNTYNSGVSIDGLVFRPSGSIQVDAIKVVGNAEIGGRLIAPGDLTLGPLDLSSSGSTLDSDLSVSEDISVSGGVYVAENKIWYDPETEEFVINDITGDAFIKISWFDYYGDRALVMTSSLGSAGKLGLFEAGKIVFSDSTDMPMLAINNGFDNFALYDSDGTQVVSLDYDGDSYLDVGNIGIGKDSPIYKVDVDGEVRADGYVFNSTNMDITSGDDYIDIGYYETPYLRFDQGDANIVMYKPMVVSAFSSITIEEGAGLAIEDEDDFTIEGTKIADYVGGGGGADWSELPTQLALQYPTRTPQLAPEWTGTPQPVMYGINAELLSGFTAQDVMDAINAMECPTPVPTATKINIPTEVATYGVMLVDNKVGIRKVPTKVFDVSGDIAASGAIYSTIMYPGAVVASGVISANSINVGPTPHPTGVALSVAGDTWGTGSYVFDEGNIEVTPDTLGNRLLFGDPSDPLIEMEFTDESMIVNGDLEVTGGITGLPTPLPTSTPMPTHTELIIPTPLATHSIYLSGGLLGVGMVPTYGIDTPGYVRAGSALLSSGQADILGGLSANSISLKGSVGVSAEYDGSTPYQSGLNLNTYDSERSDMLSRVTIDGEQEATEVGIGTTTPAYTLDVSGTANVTGNATVGGDLGVAGDATVGDSLALSNGKFFGWENSGGSFSNNIRLDTSNDLQITCGVYGRNIIFNESAGNEIMRLTDEGSTGYVGINEADPSYSLDVDGYINSSEGYYAGGYTGAKLYGYSSDLTALGVYGTRGIAISQSNNRTYVFGRLDLAAAGTLNTGPITFNTSAWSDIYSYSGSGIEITVRKPTAGTSMSVLSVPRQEAPAVGINTTAPDYTLDVDGDTYVEDKLLRGVQYEEVGDGATTITVEKGILELDNNNDDYDEAVVTLSGGEDGQSLLVFTTQNNDFDSCYVKYGPSNSQQLSVDNYLYAYEFVYVGGYWRRKQ